jgi:hypothetical protein
VIVNNSGLVRKPGGLFEMEKPPAGFFPHAMINSTDKEVFEHLKLE